MAKLFISLPMHNYDEKEVLARMAQLKGKAEKTFGMELDVIDTYYKSFVSSAKNPRIDYLGDSIRQMADADFVFFDKRWNTANGCKVEMKVADTYGIPYAVETFGEHEFNPFDTFDGEVLHVKKEYLDHPLKYMAGPKDISVRLHNALAVYMTKLGVSRDDRYFDREKWCIKLRLIDGRTKKELSKVRRLGKKCMEELLIILNSINAYYEDNIIYVGQKENN